MFLGFACHSKPVFDGFESHMGEIAIMIKAAIYMLCFNGFTDGWRE